MRQLVLEVLGHALAFSEEEPSLARGRVRRVLYTRGLPGLLAGAPEDLLQRVASAGHPERLVLRLFEELRDSAATADSESPPSSLPLRDQPLPYAR